MRPENDKSTPVSTHVRKKRRKPSRILFRTVFFSWIVVIFTTGIFVLSIIPYQKKQLFQEMTARAKVTFTSIAQVTVTSILIEDYSTVVDHCMTVIRENPSILYAVITRHDGFSLVHTKGKWSQDELDGLWKPDSNNFSEKGHFITSSLVNQEVFHRSFPFQYSGIDWGWIHIGLSPHRFYADLKALYFRTFLIALLSVSIGLIASYFFARRLSKPILLLDEVTQQVATGNLSARVKIKTGDEIENLAHSFNQMTAALSKSQNELDETHKKLVETARSVGMAEVATGILHNVGNVLNSVGITTASITNKIRNSKIMTFSKIADQFKEHEDDLMSFLSSEGRAKKLVSLLSGLSEYLIEEQEKQLGDLGKLAGHIQHITEIVNLQQLYSKTVGMVEPVSVTELLEDAIRINGESLARHNIELKRDIGSIPSVMLDRHKVLQILLNLINNAKHSLTSTQKENKMIKVNIKKDDDNEYVQIDVTDNGLGISEENLTRIFNYGFTTKKKGHGFGLHSGALNAKEMGGSLVAQSEGPGKGATFTLELPFKPGIDPNG